MKTTILVILLGLTALVCAEDVTWPVLRTKSGKEFHAVKLVKVEPAGIKITHDNGAGRIDFEDLPADLQKALGYDPAAAAKQRESEQNARQVATASAAVAAADRQALKAMVKTADKIRGRVLSVTKDGVLLTDAVHFVNEVILESLPDRLCFVVCDTAGMVDGTDVEWTVFPTGRYHYASVLGASHTIKCFARDAATAVKMREAQSRAK